MDVDPQPELSVTKALKELVVGTIVLVGGLAAAALTGFYFLTIYISASYRAHEPPYKESAYFLVPGGQDDRFMRAVDAVTGRYGFTMTPSTHHFDRFGRAEVRRDYARTDGVRLALWSARDRNLLGLKITDPDETGGWRPVWRDLKSALADFKRYDYLGEAGYAWPRRLDRP